MRVRKGGSHDPPRRCTVYCPLRMYFIVVRIIVAYLRRAHTIMTGAVNMRPKRFVTNTNNTGNNRCLSNCQSSLQSHPVYVTNVAQRQASVDPHTKLTDLDCCYCLHPPTIFHRFVTQLIIILPSHERTEGRMSWRIDTAVRCAAYAKAVYHMIAVVLVTNIQTVCDRIFWSCDLSPCIQCEL